MQTKDLVITVYSQVFQVSVNFTQKMAAKEKLKS